MSVIRFTSSLPIVGVDIRLDSVTDGVIEGPVCREMAVSENAASRFLVMTYGFRRARFGRLASIFDNIKTFHAINRINRFESYQRL